MNMNRSMVPEKISQLRYRLEETDSALEALWKKAEYDGKRQSGDVYHSVYHERADFLQKVYREFKNKFLDSEEGDPKI